MKKYFGFLAITFGAGLVFQSVFFYVVPAGVPTPQWLLLAVLALGAQGRIKTATTVGFFWGLALDAFGVTAFGTQGWLMALAGYGAGSVSKNVNADKWGAQESLTIAATLVLAIGIRILSALFVDAPVGVPGWGVPGSGVPGSGVPEPGRWLRLRAWRNSC